VNVKDSTSTCRSPFNDARIFPGAVICPDTQSGHRSSDRKALRMPDAARYSPNVASLPLRYLPEPLRNSLTLTIRVKSSKSAQLPDDDTRKHYTSDRQCQSRADWQELNYHDDANSSSGPDTYALRTPTLSAEVMTMAKSSV